MGTTLGGSYPGVGFDSGVPVGLGSCSSLLGGDDGAAD